MRIAAIYDIHGNLPALEAVLADVVAAGVDEIIVGGDVMLGPMPVEVLEQLVSLQIPVSFLRGNCDRIVVDQMEGRSIEAVPAQFHEAIKWNAEQMTAEQGRA